MVGSTRAVAWLVLSAWAAMAVPADGQSVKAGAEAQFHAWEKRLVLPQKVSARLSWAQRRLRPSGLRNLEKMGRTLAPAAVAGTDFQSLQKRAEADVIGSYPGLAAMEVSEAAFLVMSMATKDMDDDIRLVMSELRAMNAAKQKMRDMITELNRWISEELSRHPAAGDIDNEKTGGSKAASRAPQPAVRTAAPPGRRMTLETRTTPVIRLEYVKTPAIPPLPPRSPGLTISGLKSLLDDLKGNLDGMNEMSEMTSLRLQMTMDRRSKFVETLSNIMKKIGATQESLAQNIK